MILGDNLPELLNPQFQPLPLLSKLLPLPQNLTLPPQPLSPIDSSSGGLTLVLEDVGFGGRGQAMGWGWH